MRRLAALLPLLLLFFQALPYAAPVANSSEPNARPAADDNAPLPTAAQMERLARTRPVEFLQTCLRRYDRSVQGYTCVLQKQERIGGKLQRSEVIEAAFREQPFSVSLRWLEGARKASAVTYVEGENGGNMLARPALGLLRSLVVQRDPEGEDARQSGRYTVKQFGIKKAMERTLQSWTAAQDRGDLHIECRGDFRVKEAGDRLCVALHRGDYARPEDDGVTDLTVYYDKETWLQVGSVLKGEEGKVMGAYYFRDIRLNPEFKPEQFTREGLKP
jgi:hypothetical protein